MKEQYRHTTPSPEGILSHLDKPVSIHDITEGEIANSEYSPSSLRKFADRIAQQMNVSPTIERNPQAILSFKEEATNYLRHKAEDTLYWQELQDHASALLEQSLQEERISVCIAVAAHQEGEGLYRTLEQYAKQSQSPSFEIILYLNQPEFNQSGERLSSDAARDTVDQFKADYPNLSVLVMDKIYDGDVGIGKIKTTLYDTTMLLHYERGTEDPIIILNDADVISIPPNYVGYIAGAFDQDFRLDGIAGQLEWEREALMTRPALLLATRAYQYINSVKAAQEEYYVFAGANSALRGSAYCAVGGGRNLARGEDAALGLALRVMRGGNDYIQVGGNDMTIETSARRSLAVYSLGFAPNEKWRTTFGAFDDTVRSFSVVDFRTELAKPLDYNEILTSSEALLDRTLDVYEGAASIGKGATLYRHALGNLGLSYDVLEDESIKFIGRSNELFEALEIYRKHLLDGVG